MISLVTYATHEAGNFKNMVNNTYGHPVTVLGMGEKWNGFMDKFKALIKHCESITDKNELLVFLDGFDVWINTANLKTVEREFLKTNSRILFSISENDWNYLAQKMFLQPNHRWKGISIANTGLYMGYVGDIEKFLKIILASDKNWRDDQEAVNYYIHDMPEIHIDTAKKIFQNVHMLKPNIRESYTAYFIQNNGRLTIERISRVWKEYHPYFIPELCVIFFILGMLWVKNRYLVLGAGLIFLCIMFAYNQHFEKMTATDSP